MPLDVWFGLLSTYADHQLNHQQETDTESAPQCLLRLCDLCVHAQCGSSRCDLHLRSAGIIFTLPAWLYQVTNTRYTK